MLVLGIAESARVGKAYSPVLGRASEQARGARIPAAARRIAAWRIAPPSQTPHISAPPRHPFSRVVHHPVF